MAAPLNRVAEAATAARVDLNMMEISMSLGELPRMISLSIGKVLLSKTELIYYLLMFTTLLMIPNPDISLMM